MENFERGIEKRMVKDLKKAEAEANKAADRETTPEARAGLDPWRWTPRKRGLRHGTTASGVQPGVQGRGRETGDQYR